MPGADTRGELPLVRCLKSIASSTQNTLPFWFASRTLRKELQGFPERFPSFTRSQYRSLTETLCTQRRRCSEVVPLGTALNGFEVIFGATEITGFQECSW